MWIMHSDCFLSIVSKDCGPTELLVRARRNGDIEKVFPSAKVIRSTGTRLSVSGGDTTRCGETGRNRNDRPY